MLFTHWLYYFSINYIIRNDLILSNDLATCFQIVMQEQIEAGREAQWQSK